MDLQQQVEYPGREITLGKQTFVIPSLSIGDAKRLWPSIMKLNQLTGPEDLPQSWEVCIDVIFSAIRRNYPEMTKELVESLLGMDNFYDVYVLVAIQSQILTRRSTQPGGIGPVDGELGASANEKGPVV